MLDAIAELKERWAHGETTTNCWLMVPNSFTAEIAGRAGFDTLCIDMQHGLVDFDAVPSMLQAAAGANKPTLVRVPWNEPSIIMRALDVGAAGVIVPLVETAEDARRAVAACLYPPAGNRSFGPSRAAVVMSEYFERAQTGLLVFVMVETVKGLENLDAIVATPGLTGVYIGPADLSLSLGFPPESDSGRHVHQDAVKKIISTCHERGLVVGLHCHEPSFAAVASGWGADMVTIGTDVNALKLELARRVAEFHASTP